MSRIIIDPEIYSKGVLLSSDKRLLSSDRRSPELSLHCGWLARVTWLWNYYNCTQFLNDHRGPADSPVAKKQRQGHNHSPQNNQINKAGMPTLKRERSNTIGTPVRVVAPRNDRSLSGGRRKRCRTLSKPSTPMTTRGRTMSLERPASAAGMVEGVSHSHRAGSLDKLQHRKPGMPTIKPKLTMPKTPTFMK